MTRPLYIDEYAWDPEDGPATLDQLEEERERELQDRDADREFCGEPFVPNARYL